MMTVAMVTNYLMPALLNPRLDKWVCGEKELVEPLLVCLPKGCVPYGIFSYLVTFLQHKFCVVEKDNVPDCLYKGGTKISMQNSPSLIQYHTLKCILKLVTAPKYVLKLDSLFMRV